MQLLLFVGDARNLWSSIEERLAWPIAAALVLAPAAYWRFARGARLERRWVAAALALALAWSAAGRAWLAGFSTGSFEQRLAQNPHRVLLASAALELMGRRSLRLPSDVPARYRAELEAPAARSPRDDGAASVRNLIVVVLESVGAHHLSLYGSRHPTTPSLLAEAKHALVFDAFYAHVGYSFCSFVALQFSVYPGLPWCYVPCGEPPFPVTLAGLLRQRGHATAMLSSPPGRWLAVEVCARVYRPRRARESPLFRLVDTHLEEPLRVWPERFAKLHGAVPRGRGRAESPAADPLPRQPRLRQPPARTP